MENEAFIDEFILNSIEILLKEISRLLVDSEHKLKHLLIANMHHHIKNEVLVSP